MPPELGKSKVTILVIKHNKKSYDKYLIANWKKYYDGEYEIIDKSQVEKYTDKNRYRYIFDGKVSTSKFQNPDGRYTYLQAGTFFVVDRQTDKTYGGRIESGMWSKLLIANIEKMNEKITKGGN
jgi:hypothetical protein